MVSKKRLIKNLRDYSPIEVAEAINAGVVTMYELSESGKLTPLMRKDIEDALNTSISQVTIKQEEQKDEEGIKTPTKPSAPIVANAVSSPITNIEPISCDDNVNEERIYYNKPSFTNKGMFRRPFSFKGRIRRLEYGISCLISGILYSMWDMILQEVAKEAEYGYIPSGIVVLLYLVYIPVFWFTIAQGCKRCHDLNNNGWWQLIPFYGLVMLFGDGDLGNNDYGDNPKGK